MRATQLGNSITVDINFTEPVYRVSGKDLPTGGVSQGVAKNPDDSVIFGPDGGPLVIHSPGDWRIAYTHPVHGLVLGQAEGVPVDYFDAAGERNEPYVLAAGNFAVGYGFPPDGTPVAVTLDVAPGNEARRVGGLRDAVGNVIPEGASSDPAVDLYAPFMTSARLATPTSVEVAFSEPVTVEFAAGDWSLPGATIEGASGSGDTHTFTVAAGFSTSANLYLRYTNGDAGAGSVRDTSTHMNAMQPGKRVLIPDTSPPVIVSSRFVDADTAEVRFSEQMAAAPPAEAITVRDGGDVVATATGAPALSTPPGGRASSVLTFDIAPTAPGLDRVPDGLYRLHVTGIVDASPAALPFVPDDGNAAESALLDTPPTAAAAFPAPDRIVLAFSEAMDPATLGDGAFSVEPAGLAARDGAAAPPVAPVAYDAGARTVTLTLARPAAAGEEQTVVPSSGIRDADGEPDAFSTSPIRITHYPVTLASVSYAVRDGTSGMGRPQPFENHAREGDDIVLSVSLEGMLDADAPPVVRFVGGEAATTMSRAGDTGPWAATYTVEPASAAPGIDGPLTFAVTATSATPTAFVLTQGDAPPGSPAPPVIDRVAPVAAVGFAAADEIATVDKIVVTFSEPLANAPGTGWGVTRPGDPAASVLSSSPAPAYSGGGDSPTVTLTLTAKADGGSYTVTPPSGMATLTDAAGNALPDASWTISHGAPTFTAKTSSRTTTVVTPTQPLISGSTGISQWSVTTGADESAVDYEVTSLRAGSHSAPADDPSQSLSVAPGSAVGAITLVHGPLPSTGATPTVTYAHDGDARARAAGGQLGPGMAMAGDGAPPGVVDWWFEGQEVNVEFGEDVAVASLPDVEDMDLDLDLYAEPSGGEGTHAIGSRSLAASAAGMCTMCVYKVTFTTETDDNGMPVPVFAAGGVHYLDLAGLADNNMNARPEGRLRIEHDTTAPAATASFTSARVIVIGFDDRLAEALLGDDSFAVSRPDTTADPDSDPDAVALDAEAPFSYEASPAGAGAPASRVTLRLATDAERGVTYTISPKTEPTTDMPPVTRSTVLNEARLARYEGPVTAVHAPPITSETASVSSIEVVFAPNTVGAVSASQFAVTDSDASATARAVASVAATGGAAGETAVLGADRTVTLALASPLASSGSTPTVAYTASPAVAIPGAALRAGEAWADTADDGVPPEIVDWWWEHGATPALNVELDEDVAASATVPGHLYASEAAGAPLLERASGDMPQTLAVAALEGKCAACLYGSTFDGAPADGAEYYLPAASVVDASGNHRPATERIRIAYDPTAPAATASFVGTRTIAVEFDDRLDASTLAAGSLAVTRPGAGPDDPVPVALDPAAPPAYEDTFDGEDATRGRITLTLAADADLGVMYTIGPGTGTETVTGAFGATVARSAVQNEGHVAYGGGGITITNSALFEARTTGLDTIEVTFRDGVAGALGAAQLAVTDSDAEGDMPGTARPVATVRATGGAAGTTATLGADRTVTLALSSPLASTGSVPTVTYTAPGQGALTNEGAALTSGSKWSDAASDGVAPTLVSVSFADSDTVAATFSEAIADPSALGPALYAAAAGGAPSNALSGTPSRGSPPGPVLTFDVAPAVPDGSSALYADLAGVADVAGNAYAQAAREQVAHDTTAVSITSTVFSGTRTILVNFDDALDVRTPLGPANFAVTAPDDTNVPHDGDENADAIALDAGAPVAYDAASMSVTLLLAGDAVEGVTYTVTPSSVANEARAPYGGGAVEATYEPPFEARTTSKGTTLVTFEDSVTATFAASEWAVADSDAQGTARAVTGVSGSERSPTPAPTHEVSVGRRLAVHHDALATSASTPSVSYTVPPGGLLIGLSMPRALPAGGTWTVTAADAAPLAVASYEFAGERGLRIAFEEDIDLASTSLSEPHLHATHNSEEIVYQRLEFGAAADGPEDDRTCGACVYELMYVDPDTSSKDTVIADGEYYVELGAIVGADGNTHAPSRLRVLKDTSAPAFTAAVSGSGASLALDVTFSDPLYLAPGGALPVPGDWRVAFEGADGVTVTGTPAELLWSPDAPPAAATPAVQVYGRDGAVAYGPAALPAPATSVSMPISLPAGVRDLTSALPPATLTFMPAAERAGTLANEAGAALASGASAEPTDPVAPRLVGATLESDTRVRATFSEAVTLSDAGRAVTELAGGAVAADWSLPGTTFESAVADGRDVTLTARAGRATSVGPAESLAYSGASVTDMTANAAATGIAALADSAAPRIASARTASPTTIEVTLSEPATGSVSLGEWSVALAATDAADGTASTVVPTSMSAPGATLAGGTLTLASPATAVTLEIGVAMADDATPKVSYAELPSLQAATYLSDTQVRLTFSEGLDEASVAPGAFSFEGPGTAPAVSMADLDAALAPAAFRNTVTLTLDPGMDADGRYTATAKERAGGGPGVTDADGNALAADQQRALTRGPAPPELQAATRISDTQVRLTFSEGLDEASVAPGAFSFEGPGTAITVDAASLDAALAPATIRNTVTLARRDCPAPPLGGLCGQRPHRRRV